MRLLLDECVPRKLKNHLPGIECQTVPEADLAGRKNQEEWGAVIPRRTNGVSGIPDR
jgi:hypothetical protein